MERMDLTKESWSFFLSKEQPNVANVTFADSICLPSTVQQAKKSPETDERSTGYLTDPHRFEGYALYSRTVELSATMPAPSVSLFFVMERTRTSRLWINGKEVGTQNSLCAPHRYDITAYAAPKLTIMILIDNVSCPVPGGHMTSADTQTNWLGITGDVYLEAAPKLRYEKIRITPFLAKDGGEPDAVLVDGSLVGGEALTLTAEVEGFPAMSVSLTADAPSFSYPIAGAVRWDEHHPVCYHMILTYGGERHCVPFGLRTFSTQGTKLLLNGEPIFLRGKHDGMLFPLTGAAPTDIASWRSVLQTAKKYGINHYRFHTCCPPEAAFCAADELGVYLEPELPFWGTVDEDLTDAQRYLVEEGFRILDSFANHPSFFALSLGNELWGSKERLNAILGDYKAYDPRPLYTQGSNNFQFWPCVLEHDDLFVGVRFSKERLIRGSYAMCDAPLGHIQTDAPNASHTYDTNIRPASLRAEANEGGTIEIQYGTGVKTVSLADAGSEFVSEVPVISHEVGQYFMYPDYREISHYTGVLKPYNLEIFRERLTDAGLLPFAERFFAASGAFAAACYKNEIETALRSHELSGFQLLDLQDFSGQGTALVGILNALMENKGIISAEAWRGFCSDRVLLGMLSKYVFSAKETLDVPVLLYTYTGETEVNPSVTVTLTVEGDDIFTHTLTAEGSMKHGLFSLGMVSFALPDVTVPKKAVLTLRGGERCNRYELWVYPEIEEPSLRALDGDAVVTKDWQTAKAALAAGKRVLYLPHALSEGHAVEGTYCTDFWNYPMFASISKSMNKPLPVGTLGLLIDNTHPALAAFPSDFYSTPQWYDIVTDSQSAILDGTDIVPIVRTIDNCERNHNLGLLFEAKVGEGALLVCTARLDEKAGSLPCRHLLKSLVEYVASEEFRPEVEVDGERLEMWG